MVRLALLSILFTACTTRSERRDERFLPDAMVHPNVDMVVDADAGPMERRQDGALRDVLPRVVPGGGDSGSPMVTLDGSAEAPVEVSSSRDAGLKSTQVFPGLCCGTPGALCGPSPTGKTQGECCPSNLSTSVCQARWSETEWCYCSAGWECMPSTRVRDTWECLRNP